MDFATALCVYVRPTGRAIPATRLRRPFLAPRGARALALAAVARASATRGLPGLRAHVLCHPLASMIAAGMECATLMRAAFATRATMVWTAHSQDLTSAPWAAVDTGYVGHAASAFASRASPVPPASVLATCCVQPRRCHLHRLPQLQSGGCQIEVLLGSHHGTRLALRTVRATDTALAVIAHVRPDSAASHAR